MAWGSSSHANGGIAPRCLLTERVASENTDWPSVVVDWNAGPRLLQTTFFKHSYIALLQPLFMISEGRFIKARHENIL